MPFTDSPWNTPESDLTPEEFCSVCVVDMNEGEKVKEKCKLPVRSSPGAPYNKNAIRNAMARLSNTDMPSTERRKAARKLVRLAREADIEVGEAILRIAGMR